MINKILNLYRSGNLTQDDLFLGLAKHAEDLSWNIIVKSLSDEERASFRTWAAQLVKGETNILLSTGYYALRDKQISALQVRFKELAWMN
jgi:hypothetical protein